MSEHTGSEIESEYKLDFFEKSKHPNISHEIKTLAVHNTTLHTTKT